MKRVVRWLKIALPFIRIAADELADIDANETGADDRAAVALEYVADIVEAIKDNKPIPTAPASLVRKDEARPDD